MWRLRGSIGRAFCSDNQLALQKYYKSNPSLKGSCSALGSLKYSRRNSKVHKDHWSNPVGLIEQLKISSLGVGTFGAIPTAEQDLVMFNSLVSSLTSGGVNLVDTCCVYRQGKSEKVINAVLNYLINECSYQRNQFMIMTKCGFLPVDIDSDLKEDKIVDILVDLKVPKEEIVDNVHCVHPLFIDFSVQKSRLCLGVDKIDVVYLNNFSESQLAVIGMDQFKRRLILAFTKFEHLRGQGKINYYGICQFAGFRIPQTQQQIHLNLQWLASVAKQIAGDQHGFRFVMTPFNLGMPQAILKWQKYESEGTKHNLNLFQVAKRQQINIVSCSPLMQGKIATVPFTSTKLNYLSHNSAKHLQLVRSFSSQTHLATLVTHSSQQHLLQNLQIIEHPKLTESEWNEILPH